MRAFPTGRCRCSESALATSTLATCPGAIVFIYSHFSVGERGASGTARCAIAWSSPESRIC